jgi:hypothetical protein
MYMPYRPERSCSDVRMHAQLGAVKWGYPNNVPTASARTV